MAADNFHACLAETFHQEGVNSNDRGDPGGATRFGITHAEFERWQKGLPAHAVPLRSIWTLTRAEAEEIYKAWYWNAVGCDALASGLDLAVFDAAVNNGVRRANGWLATVQNMPTEQAIKVLCETRLKFDKRLGIWRIFGRGWNKRIKEVYARSLVMARGYAKPEKAPGWYTLMSDFLQIALYIQSGKVAA